MLSGRQYSCSQVFRAEWLTWLVAVGSLVACTVAPSRAVENVTRTNPATARETNCNIDTVLMRATFSIVGPTKPLLCGLSNVATGTCFLVSPQADATEPGAQQTQLVLVTAAHVLNSINGDVAFLRFRIRENNVWKELDIPVSIRAKGKPLFVQHDTADVAVLDLLLNVEPNLRERIRSNIGIIPLWLLADDNKLADLELHPGDDLSCLGFPLGLSTEGAFPLLRGGKVASYPILPTHTYKQFFFDFEVFPGNSGGPVYLNICSRVTSKGISVGPMMSVVGLLSAELLNGQPLKMGVVVPASFILEAINKLASKDAPK
jgi:hypothetical protein